MVRIRYPSSLVWTFSYCQVQNIRNNPISTHSFTSFQYLCLSKCVARVDRSRDDLRERDASKHRYQIYILNRFNPIYSIPNMKLPTPLIRQLVTSPPPLPSVATSITPSSILSKPLQRRHTHNIPTHVTPQFSSSVTDPSTALSSLTPLLQTPDPSPRTSPASTSTPTGKWTLTPSRTGLQRTYHFKTFNAAWGFMSVVAERCKVERHHPEWFNVCIIALLPRLRVWEVDWR